MAVPNMWRIKKQRYSLQGEICSACSHAVFPPRQICPSCGSAMDGLSEHGLSEHGLSEQRVRPLAFGIIAQPQHLILEQPVGDD